MVDVTRSWKCVGSLMIAGSACRFTLGGVAVFCSSGLEAPSPTQALCYPREANLRSECTGDRRSCQGQAQCAHDAKCRLCLLLPALQRAKLRSEFCVLGFCGGDQAEVQHPKATESQADLQGPHLRFNPPGNQNLSRLSHCLSAKGQGFRSSPRRKSKP